MAKIQINDVELNGAELFNDSETFLNELQDSEMEQIFGGLSKVPDENVRTTVYIPPQPYPTKPPFPWKPPIHPEGPIKFPHPITPVIL